MNVTQSDVQQLNQMLTGTWLTQGIYVAAELGIADFLSNGPSTTTELADKTGTHGPSLYRLLRALAGIGLFKEEAGEAFSLTPLGDRLRSDAFESQRCFAIMMGTEFYETWGALLHSVRTGEQGFRKKFGRSFFEHMTKNPDRHRIYDTAMTGIHGPETSPMLDAYDFSAVSSIVDIGGGKGSMLGEILVRTPDATGILFDLPAVADAARAMLSAAGLADRCRTVGGDFFQSVPPGADAYLLRHVIHDWEDENAVRILRTCREAMQPESRLLVIEMVIPTDGRPSFGQWLDLMMLLIGGRERTEEQYRQLFAQAGLTLSRVVPTESEVSILEGIPR